MACPVYYFRASQFWANVSDLYVSWSKVAGWNKVGWIVVWRLLYLHESRKFKWKNLEHCKPM